MPFIQRQDLPGSSGWCYTNKSDEILLPTDFSDDGCDAGWSHLFCGDRNTYDVCPGVCSANKNCVAFGIAQDWCFLLSGLSSTFPTTANSSTPYGWVYYKDTQTDSACVMFPFELYTWEASPFPPPQSPNPPPKPPPPPWPVILWPPQPPPVPLWPTFPTAENSLPDRGTPNVGLIAGIACGAFAFLIVTASIVWWIIHKRSTKKQEKSTYKVKILL